MDPHRRAEQRSLAYHGWIAARLPHDTSLLERARARVQQWLQSDTPAPRYAHAWRAVLAQEELAIVRFLTDPSEEAEELRQSSPFAGALTARERWQLWRSVDVSDGDEP